MKQTLSSIIICSLLSACVTNGVVTKHQMKKGQTKLEVFQGPVCLFEDIPDLDHKVLGKILSVKTTYGDVSEVVPKFIRQAKELGANAVFNVEMGQKFRSPVPWKSVVPQARGTAVFVDEMFSCEAFGGKLYE